MPNQIPRRRLHRIVFIVAGVYNISWGLYACYDPQWLFRFSGMPLLNHPQIFACLGKILGPIGLARLIWDGTWPNATIALCLTNDLIWWIPFALYLIDAWPAFIRDFRSAKT